MSRRLLILALLLFGGHTFCTQQPQKTRVLVVLDCTRTMGDRWQSDSKLRVTQQVLTSLLDSLDDVELALRVYGNQLKVADGTRLEVPFSPDSRNLLQRKLRTLVPGGQGKASTALSKCRHDFPDDPEARNIILLITDGQQRDKDLCSLAGQMQMSGNILKTFILCIDPDGTGGMDDCGGMVTHLRGEEHLAETLMDMFHMTDRKAFLTLSLLDEEGKPFETEVPVVLYDHLSHAARYSTLYSYAEGEEPDTLEVDPLIMYDVSFLTHPPVEVGSVLLKAGQHRTVTAMGAEGVLRVALPDKRVAWSQDKYTVLVYNHGTRDIVCSQQTGDPVTLLAGHYDVEVLTTPPTRIDDFTVTGNVTTELQIAMPGQLALTKPKDAIGGKLFVEENRRLRWIFDLDDATPTERFVLMPGQYQIILPAPDSIIPVTSRFTITTAQQTNLTIVYPTNY